VIHELAAYEQAIEVCRASTYRGEGRKSASWPAPFLALIPGIAQYDGKHRTSYVATAVCVRLDLNRLPAALATRLRARYPEQIGTDGAFYEMGIKSRSEHSNREDALRALASKIESVQAS
jgi:hypothetical protein